MAWQELCLQPMWGNTDVGSCLSATMGWVHDLAIKKAPVVEKMWHSRHMVFFFHIKREKAMHTPWGWSWGYEWVYNHIHNYSYYPNFWGLEPTYSHGNNLSPPPAFSSFNMKQSLLELGCFALLEIINVSICYKYIVSYIYKTNLLCLADILCPMQPMQ